MKMTTVALMIVTLLVGASNADDKKPTQDDAVPITVTVRLSVETYDPAKPAGTLTCLVKNRSPKAIYLPVEYGSRRLVLYGGGKTHRSRSHLWKPSQPGVDSSPATKPRMLQIDPGETTAVFEVSLEEILTPKFGRDRRWAWNWPNRMEPPRTPIHGWRRPGYEENAGFAVELQIGKDKYKSEPAVLGVRPGKP